MVAFFVVLLVRVFAIRCLSPPPPSHRRLNGNQIGDDGLVALAYGIACTDSLQVLHVLFTSEDAKIGMAAMTAALVLNTSLNKYVLCAECGVRSAECGVRCALCGWVHARMCKSVSLCVGGVG
jgi:hypothetical protein